MNCGRLFRWASGIGVPLMLAGCGPKIMDFDVQPRRVCAGDSVHITWKVRGTPQLLSEWRVENSVDILRYTLVTESRGKQASSRMDVITFKPGAPASLVFNTDMLGTDSLVAQDTLSPVTWHGLARIGEVTSDSGRQVLVRHAGIDAVIGPGRTASSAWRGQVASGPWEIHSGLKPGEVPGTVRHPPTHLYLRMSVVCDAGRATP